jgi:hypothetical protein
MGKKIRISKSFEEQELYFLDYFFQLSPSERLQKLAALQRANFKDFFKPSVKKLTIRKEYFANGH